MTKPVDLEKRIRVLEDIEAIKKLKSRHWYCLDNKLWDELADCFAKDFVLDVSSGLKLQGRKAFIQHLTETLGARITVHQGHSPEIEITSDTTARGRWALSDHVIYAPGNSGFTGWGFYEDEYTKEEGQW